MKTSQIDAEFIVDQVIELALDSIIVDAESNFSRFAPSSIAKLADSIRSEGLINALVVGPADENGKHKLIAGFRRYRALQEIGFPARVTIRQSEDAMKVNTAENVQREELTLMDYSALIQRKKAAGVSGKDIAKEIGQSQSWVSQVAKFMTLRPAIQNRIHKGEINFAIARELPAMTEPEQDAEIVKLDNPATKADKKKAKKEATKHKGPTMGDLLSGIEPLTIEPANDGENPSPRETKSQIKKREIVAIVIGYMKGKYGAKALDNKLTEVL